MSRFFIALTFLFSVIHSPLSASAQSESRFEGLSDWQVDRILEREKVFTDLAPQPWQYHFGFDRSFIAEPRYDQMVERAYRARPESFGFSVMRQWYVYSEHYTPYTDDLKNALWDTGFQLQNARNAEEGQRAIAAFNLLMREHLGNLEIVTQALAMTRQDRRLGDPSFYEWVERGLIDILMFQGRGDRPETAYSTITPYEEDVLLRQLNVKANSTELLTLGHYYFNVYKVTDPATGEQSDLYVNVTFPIAKAEAEEALDGARGLDIGFQ